MSHRKNPVCPGLVIDGRQFRLSFVVVAASAILLSPQFVASAAETSDPVLNLLLEKGIISQQELDRARAEAAAIARTNATTLSEAQFAAASTSKWRISEGIESVELFGDLRMRYEEREVSDSQNGRIELDRARVSVRLGLRGEVLDGFYYGLRLETGSNPRSPWVTLGTSSSAVPYQGPFGKSTFNVNIGQIYLCWHKYDWLDLTVGKMANPLYTTAMAWDGDLNPEGLAEHLKYTIGLADFFANFGQFLYQDTNPTEASRGYFGLGNLYPSANGSSSGLPFLLASQAGINIRFTTNISFKIAPAVYVYQGVGVNNTATATLVSPAFYGTFVGEGATTGAIGIPAAGWSGYPGGYFAGFNANQSGVNDLLVLEFPWEFNFKIRSLDARIFGDYAQNLEGRQRAEAAYNASRSSDLPLQIGGVRAIPSVQPDEDKAYMVGVAVGNAKGLGLTSGAAARRHGWEVRAYWQHIEQYALDPNLLDSDFFEGRGNLEGVYAALAYGFTRNVIGTVRYGYARRINELLGTGGANQDIPQMNPIQKFSLLQFDLSLKF